MSSWFKQYIEPTTIHLTYLLLSTFLLFYALLSSPIRNNLHLSEPPLATLLGIAFGPKGAKFLNPRRWGIVDSVTQEATRVIVGLQVFTVGVELPKNYLSKKDHAISVAMMLGPVMTFSWLITAGFVYWILHINFRTALIIAACLAPTDPVLAASVLAESRFAHRVPARIRHMLSAESGCNDGVSFPFLYIGILLINKPTFSQAIEEWFLGTILWQCLLGTLVGLGVGKFFNFALKQASRRENISAPAFLVFYFLLAIFCVGVGSSLGVDDFLVAFGAGYGFASDGWFSHKARATHLPQILDLLLNSSMFIYFGAIIPWDLMSTKPATTSSPLAEATANITPVRLVVLLVLILFFRRIPIMLACKPFVPILRTYTEALFAGHFGPMGLGALFLVIEARAMLENGTSEPVKHPRPNNSQHFEAVQTIWPVVCFIILGSVIVHGLSVAVISVSVSLLRRSRKRTHYKGGTGGGLLGEHTRLLSGVGQETDGLEGMVHEAEVEAEEHGSTDTETDSDTPHAP